MFARTAASEVVAGQENLSGSAFGLIENEIRLGRTLGKVSPIGEEVIPEPDLGSSLQESRRNDLISIDVVNREWRHAAREGSELFHFDSLQDRSDVGDYTGYCRCSCSQRTCQERSATFALASFEVAVACGDAILAWLQLISVHGNAHGAARFTPIRTGLFENTVQSFGLRLLFHLLRTRNN